MPLPPDPPNIQGLGVPYRAMLDVPRPAGRYPVRLLAAYPAPQGDSDALGPFRQAPLVWCTAFRVRHRLPARLGVSCHREPTAGSARPRRPAPGQYLGPILIMREFQFATRRGFAVESSLAVARTVPLGLKATNQIRRPYSVQAAKSQPVPASHTFTVSSPPAVARVRPFGAEHQ